MRAKIKFFFVILILVLPGQTFALLPDEVLVIANRFVPDSVDLARYYMEKRGIPKENLLRITTTEREGCSRDIYDEEIAKPVRKAVVRNKKIKALVTIYGVPLKVGRPKLSFAENEQLKALVKESRVIGAKIKELEETDSVQEKDLKGQLSTIYKQITKQKKSDYSAAVDSELALVLNKNYDLKFWLPNPYFVGYREKKLPLTKDDVLLVSRLDGPSVEIVRRIIDDSFYAEKNGLQGKAYFDAKGPRHKEKIDSMGYAFYDNSLHLAAGQLKKRHIMPVVINENGKLFQAGEAPDAALYCGWYSYNKYIDAFHWKPGAVGYHISSVECGTLRPGKSQAWCKRMLEEGAAAVIGPVDEPYVQGFPIPEMFFTYLTDGYYNLVESYFLSLPYLSWRMVLVGDPLYRPFKNSKR